MRHYGIVAVSILIMLVLSVSFAFASEGSAAEIPDGSRGSRLTGNDVVAYKVLKKEINRIASGQESSSAVRIPMGDFTNGKTSFTEEELGVAIMDGDKVSKEAIDAFDAYFDFDLAKVLGALLADLPYEMYWYDKTVDCSTTGAPRGSNGKSIYFSGDDPAWTVDLCVSGDYSASGNRGTTEVNTAKTSKASKVTEAARKIVTDNSGKTDLEKLKAYKKAVCDLANYNNDAVTNPPPYGDPWQLIYVFDGDSSTKVLCEGYSKAFKYLCDISEFQNSKIRVDLMSGVMKGGTGEGDHMWNVVRMDNDRNYLVDLTNCDTGTYGEPDLLFLRGFESGNAESGYRFKVLSDHYMMYKYREEMKYQYDADELILSDEDYEKREDDPEVDPEPKPTPKPTVRRITKVTPSSWKGKAGKTFKLKVKYSGKQKPGITFKKTKGNKKITVTKAGKVKIKKGLKKGKYTIRVKVTLSATSQYTSAKKTVKIKIIVK